MRSNAGSMKTRGQREKNKNASNRNPLCYDLQVAHAAEGSCVSLTVSNGQDTSGRQHFTNHKTPDSITSLTSGCTAFFSRYTWLPSVALRHRLGVRISAQNGDGKRCDQLYGDIHTVLKGTHQCHVAEKRIIELACMSLRLGCNAYL